MKSNDNGESDVTPTESKTTRTVGNIPHGSLEIYDVQLLAYQLMPNHWHLVMWPRQDNEMKHSAAKTAMALSEPPPCYWNWLPVGTECGIPPIAKCSSSGCSLEN